jgi:hypothetical protein
MMRRTGTKYGVLLVTGSQTHQENYARAFAADSRCKLIAVADEPTISRRRRELNERLARELNIPYLENLDAALARNDVHIASICAEPERRGAIAVKCAQAQKQLYLDKSLAPRLSEADAIVHAVREAGVFSHMFSFISQPWAKRASIGARTPALGELLAIHADIHFAKGRPGTADLSRPRREQYPPEAASFQRIECKREMDNTGVYGGSKRLLPYGQLFLYRTPAARSRRLRFAAYHVSKWFARDRFFRANWLDEPSLVRYHSSRTGRHKKDVRLRPEYAAHRGLQ